MKGKQDVGESEFTKELKAFNYGNYKLTVNHRPMFRSFNGELNVCSKCISMFPTVKSLVKHMDSCSIAFTPFYEEKAFKISKVETLKTKQLLALISQIFIKSKTVYYEVESYDFYILFQDEIMGYFSRYKEGPHSLNCLLVLPCFQGQGWGTVLFDFSNIPVTCDLEDPGKNIIFDPKSPEKPYSKKAIFCFRKYWKFKVIGGGRTVNEISSRTNLPVNDVILGLEQQGFDFNEWRLTKKIDMKRPRMLEKRVMKYQKK